MKNKERCWMLVDDDEGMLTFMRELISQFGSIQTDCFLSPYDAHAAFAASPRDYELVITDLGMPGMDGIELCRRFHELRPDTKIVLQTGNGSVTNKIASKEGFSGLLHKPVPFAELSRLVEDMGIAQISHPD